MQANYNLVAELGETQVCHEVNFVIRSSLFFIFAASKRVMLEWLNFIFICNCFVDEELGLVFGAVELLFQNSGLAMLVFNEEFVVLAIFDFTGWVDEEGGKKV